MNLVDVHTHLDSERFDNERDEIVKRAKEAGVKFMITSGVNPTTNRTVLELSKKYSPIVKCSFGIYPIDGIANKLNSKTEEDNLRYVEKFDVDVELKWIEEHKNDCVAIGECGLDYKIIPGTEELQLEVFQKVIDLAKKIDKPLVTHSRKAELEVIGMLEKNSCKKVYMHCFGGKKALVRRCVENGYFMSVPAVITRLEHFKMLVKLTPLTQLITETDAPYLSPIAGTRNESKNVIYAIKEIAKIKGLSEVKVAKQIFNNAKTLFSL